MPWRWVLAAGTTLGVAQYSLLLLGMRAGMPAGLTSLVAQVQAVFTVILAVVLLRERITARRVAGMGVAFAGLALIALDLGDGGPIGAFVLVVGSALGWGAGNIAVRKAAPPDSLRFMVWISAVAAVPMLGLSLLVEGVPRLEFSTEGTLSVLYVALISTLGGFGVWGFLLKRYDASRGRPLQPARPRLRHVLGRPVHRRGRLPAPAPRRRPHRHRRPVRRHPPPPRLFLPYSRRSGGERSNEGNGDDLNEHTGVTETTLR